MISRFKKTISVLLLLSVATAFFVTSCSKDDEKEESTTAATTTTAAPTETPTPSPSPTSTPTPTPSPSPTPTPSPLYIEDEHIHNYLLVGIDSRVVSMSNSGGGDRSDIIMILSLDDVNKTVKLMSIARDSYAEIPGKRGTKINAAMAYGGIDLLRETVELHLRIKIDGYAFINFFKSADLIDAAGGVYVDVSEAEAYSEGGLNHNLRELGFDDQQISSTGYMLLNGNQAVAYSRIRKIDSDFMRSQRQVEILRNLFSRFNEMSDSSKLNFALAAYNCIKTDLSIDDLKMIATEFMPSLDSKQIYYLQLPIEGCSNQGTYGGEWSIRCNWNAMIPYIQDYLYGRRQEVEPAPDISNAPDLEKCPTDLKVEDLLK